MKTIVAGSREYDDYVFLKKVLDEIGDTTEIFSGCARGADQLGIRYARENKIPLKAYPANWEKYGSKGKNNAGHMRNVEMSIDAERLVAFNLGTPGTTDMINIMRRRGKPVIVLQLCEDCHRMFREEELSTRLGSTKKLCRGCVVKGGLK